jgi:probable O-glycosylation ligase (exosortase A-associated)
MKDLFFLVLFSGFVILALKNPFLGLCGWSWTIMAVPKNMLWGFSSDIRFTYILAIATFIGMFFDSDDPFKRKIRSPIIFLLILFLLHSAISNSLTLGDPELSWSVWSDLFKAIIFSILIVILLTTKTRIEVFLMTLLVGSGFNIFFEGMKFLVTAGQYNIIGIKNSMMSDNNLFALSILLLLPLYIYFVPIIKNIYLKILFIALSALSFVCVLGSLSRGGFVGLLIVAYKLFLKVKRKFIFSLFALIISTMAVYVIADRWTSRIQTIETADQDLSFLGRTTAWKLSFLSALDNPVFGVGQDSLQNQHVWLRYYEDIEILDFVPTANVSKNRAKAAHSIYFQVLGDTGFVGLLIYLSVLLLGKFKAKKLSQSGTEIWIRDLSASINISLIVFMVSGALLSLAYYDVVFCLIAILVSLEKLNVDVKEK